MPKLSSKTAKSIKSGLGKDEAFALAQKHGEENVAAAVKKWGGDPALDPEGWAAYAAKHPPILYTVHHNGIPPHDDVTAEWGPDEWAEFEGSDWEVTEYSHEPRYVVEDPGSPDGWHSAHGDPATALRFRDELRAKASKAKRKPIKVRHREKGHELEWADPDE